MQWLAEIIRAGVEYAVGAFDGLGSFWALTVLSCLTGALMLWIVGFTTPQARLERARSRLVSAIYEMRLFIDTPVLLIRAQMRLFGWFLAYMGCLLPAFVVLSVPLGVMLLHLETRYGLSPVPVDRPLIVRVDLARSSAGRRVDGHQVTADGSEYLDVTAPPLYDESTRRVYFRVRVSRPGVHVLSIHVGDKVVEKRISADPEAHQVAPQRHGGWAVWWQLGDEPPLSTSSGVRAIAIEHPDRQERWLGVSMPWWAYWLLVSTIVALLLRRPMGVVM